MGQYSIENYYPYETHKIRPKPLSNPPQNHGKGSYEFLAFSWEELEPQRGSYQLDQLLARLNNTYNPVLEIRLVIPEWLNHDHQPKREYSIDATKEAFTHLLKKVGSLIEQYKNLIGIILSPTEDSEYLWNSYIDAFTATTILIDLNDRFAIRYFQEKQVDFGLVMDCGENNWLECCELLGKQKLSANWERRPLLIRLQDNIAGSNIVRESRRWHAALANYNMSIGYNYSLRRLVYPKKITSKGGLPLRFWFVNTGTAPCYRDLQLRIKLRREDGNGQEYILALTQRRWGIGDITHNEILTLPELEEGSYHLLIGVFLEDETPMRLDIDASLEGNYYRLGSVEVDDQLENDLQKAWDDFYPEGYYPLEDPQTPKED